MNYNNRDEFFKDLKNLIPNKGIGVEIGVYKGETSKTILENWGGKLYLVDVWRPLGEEYEDMSNNAFHSDVFRECMKNIEGLEQRGIMIRTDSLGASELFRDESLDFVYIDANHSYDYVKKDLEIWFPKVKRGGIFSGHDYMDLDWVKDRNFLPNGKDKYIYTNLPNGQLYYNGIFGVNPAVDEFFEKEKLQLNIVKEWFGTWWTIK